MTKSAIPSVVLSRDSAMLPFFLQERNNFPSILPPLYTRDALK